MAGFFAKLLSIGADKDLKRYESMVARINEIEPRFSQMTDEQLAAQTVRFKERIAAGESLDDLLFEAFATVREQSLRTLGMRHFDVQLIGGMALHEGTIAEMKTGEGKTLVSTLAGYLNALSGRGVHLVTVNDYLAKRDSEWMGRLYQALGITVGLLQNNMPLTQKPAAYQADITYGTNSEFGFDYLRDNMVVKPENRVQRDHAFAIVDEVDSILIDEARTPLIISGSGTKSADLYQKFAAGVRGLREGEDFEMEEAKHTIAATEEGLRRVERTIGIDNIYSDLSGQLVNHLQQALRAEYLFRRDVNYVVQDGEVKIVDEFTGRIMEGRRYSEGLHQALEAKEGVLVREENQTLATITLQNYFRLYDKLSGMTGTALTEDAEFRDIYRLRVQPIPPNKPVARVDNQDLIYRTIDAKFDAVADEITRRHQEGQPILVGTVSIESSERLSRILMKRGIKHEILNAKHHDREAQIVAQAGRVGAVTIATNMAGRGTDILLGGNPEGMVADMLADRGIPAEEASDEILDALLSEAQAICKEESVQVKEAGGLCVIGTERHESRRIDNQLRGRSGRQGDPGSTQFYLSLEDDLMRLFAGDRLDRINTIMQKTNMPDDMPIQAKPATAAIERAQQKVEQVHFTSRKHVLEYDDVMNQQRKVIYAERNKILDGKELHAHVKEVMFDCVERAVQNITQGSTDADSWDYDALQTWVEELTGREDFDIDEVVFDDTEADLVKQIHAFVEGVYHDRANELGEEVMRMLEGQIMLRVIDTRWMNHLSEMDYLKSGIGLRGFGQRDPLVEYKQEAFSAFGQLVETMYEDFLRTVLRIQITDDAAQSEAQDFAQGASYSGPTEVDGDHGQSALRAARTQAASAAGLGEQTLKPAQTKAKTYRKSEDPDPFVGVGRNDPCPCGSGKKFKQCHGKNR